MQCAFGTPSMSLEVLHSCEKQAFSDWDKCMLWAWRESGHRVSAHVTCDPRGAGQAALPLLSQDGPAHSLWAAAQPWVRPCPEHFRLLNYSQSISKFAAPTTTGIWPSGSTLIVCVNCRLHQLEDETGELRSCVPCLKANIERLEEVRHLPLPFLGRQDPQIRFPVH